jgi:hypothetical protein
MQEHQFIHVRCSEGKLHRVLYQESAIRSLNYWDHERLKWEKTEDEFYDMMDFHEDY